MTTYVYSAILICPAELQASSNRLACAIGHDTLPGATFSVPLSVNGTEPATHFGCRAQVAQEFVTTMANAGQGVLPPIPWGDFGLTEEQVFDVLADLIHDFKVGVESPLQHFTETANDHGLSIVNSEPFGQFS